MIICGFFSNEEFRQVTRSLIKSIVRSDGKDKKLMKVQNELLMIVSHLEYDYLAQLFLQKVKRYMKSNTIDKMTEYLVMIARIKGFETDE